MGGPPTLFASLTPRERELVLSHGLRRVLNRGQTLFNQGAVHEGIYLIESGRIDTQPWITHRAPLADIPTIFPSWVQPNSGVLKAMIEV